MTTPVAARDLFRRRLTQLRAAPRKQLDQVLETAEPLWLPLGTQSAADTGAPETLG